MDCSFHFDRFGRLISVLRDENGSATISASDPAEAIASLAGALREASLTGTAECRWKEHDGEYRWMFRAHGGRMRIVVLWSSGTLTGWEHVLWSECRVAEIGEVLLPRLEALVPAPA
jgi:hypothetical protein